MGTLARPQNQAVLNTGLLANTRYGQGELEKGSKKSQLLPHDGGRGQKKKANGLDLLRHRGPGRGPAFAQRRGKKAGQPTFRHCKDNS